MFPSSLLPLFPWYIFSPHPPGVSSTASPLLIPFESSTKHLSPGLSHPPHQQSCTCSLLTVITYSPVSLTTIFPSYLPLCHLQPHDTLAPFTATSHLFLPNFLRTGTQPPASPPFLLFHPFTAQPPLSPHVARGPSAVGMGGGEGPVIDLQDNHSLPIPTKLSLVYLFPPITLVNPFLSWRMKNCMGNFDVFPSPVEREAIDLKFFLFIYLVLFDVFPFTRFSLALRSFKFVQILSVFVFFVLYNLFLAIFFPSILSYVSYVLFWSYVSYVLFWSIFFLSILFSLSY